MNADNISNVCPSSIGKEYKEHKELVEWQKKFLQKLDSEPYAEPCISFDETDGSVFVYWPNFYVGLGDDKVVIMDSIVEPPVSCTLEIEEGLKYVFACCPQKIE